jgi:hypothetical protein
MNTQVPIMAMVTGPIGSEASAVKRAFRKAIRDMKIREHDHGGLSHIEGMTLFDLKDTGDRFNIWARSLGALQIGAASLDSRISHHEISNEFTQLLQQLSKLLLECKLGVNQAYALIHAVLIRRCN